MVRRKLVSIVIPTYNRAGLVREAILSAVNQTYPWIEVIVVDNASTDGSWNEIVELEAQFPVVHAVRNATNIGPVRNWKRGVDMARGVFCKILWSDDLIDSDFLSVTVPLLEQSEVGAVFSAVALFSGRAHFVRNRYSLGLSRIISSESFVRGLVAGVPVYPVSPGCALFRTGDLRESLLDRYPVVWGGDPTMHGVGPDLLIFLTIANKYSLIAHVARPMARFRMHPQSITVSSERAETHYRYAAARASFVFKSRPDLGAILRFHLIMGRLRSVKFLTVPVAIRSAASVGDSHFDGIMHFSRLLIESTKIFLDRQRHVFRELIL